ncbi:hypothetical protein K502DRAFT_366793 [Neoconidiobolus thromboides FSU 785]|nr:hypothetical protein K502DRAFT_366793 [Neoconidiobolus thromboides FSU 785]
MVVACLRCRKDKKKCDGVQPLCTRCNTKDWSCAYPEVARQPRVKVSEIRKKVTYLEGIIKKLGLDNLSKWNGAKIDSIIDQYRCDNFYNNNDGFNMNFKLRENMLSNFINSNTSTSMTKRVKQPYLNYLMRVFIDHCHPTLPFISLEKLRSYQSEVDINSALMCAILCKTHRYLQQIKNKSTLNPPLNEDRFYNHVIYLLQNNNSYQSLSDLQAEILIGFEEFGQNLKDICSQRDVKIMARAHILNLHNLTSYTESITKLNDTENRFERVTTWITCIFYDQIIAMFTKKPTLTPAQFLEQSYIEEIQRIDSEIFGRGNSVYNGSMNIDRKDSIKSNGLSLTPPSLSYDKDSDTSSESPNTSLYYNKYLRHHNKSCLSHLIQFPRLVYLWGKVYTTKYEIMLGKNGEEELKKYRQFFLNAIEISNSSVCSLQFNSRDFNTHTYIEDNTLLLRLQLYLMLQVIQMEAYQALIVTANIEKDKKHSLVQVDRINEIENIYKPKMILAYLNIMKVYHHEIDNYWDPFLFSSIFLVIPLLGAVLLAEKEKLNQLKQVDFNYGRDKLYECVIAWPLVSFKIDHAKVNQC